MYNNSNNNNTMKLLRSPACTKITIKIKILKRIYIIIMLVLQSLTILYYTRTKLFHKI